MRYFALIIALLAIGCSSAHKNSKSVTLTADGKHDTALAKSENAKAYDLILQGKYDEAEAACRRAVDADVMFGPPHNNLGLIYYHQDKLYPAAWEFQNAIKLMPYTPEPRNNLGLVFEKAGKLTNAADAYARARDMEPDNPQYLANLARAKVRHGDRDEDTRRLLEEVVMKDDRPEWRGWAKLNLYRLSRPVDEVSAPPASAPATPNGR